MYDIYVSHMLNGLFTVTNDWLPVIWVNRDVCHMWGRQCSLFPEHLISLPLGSSWFTHSIYIPYILLNLSVLGLCLRINRSGLFAWISRTAFLSRMYFIMYTIYIVPPPIPPLLLSHLDTRETANNKLVLSSTGNCRKTAKYMQL